MEKRELRKLMKERLNSMNATDKQKENKDAGNKLKSFLLDSYPRQHIGFYASMPEELGTQEIISILIDEGFRISLPRVYGQDMSFYEISEVQKKQSCTESNYDTSIYGILEPLPERHSLSDEQIKVLVIPGLAFDRDGHRLGRGKGFYDRFLEKHPDVIKIAYCHTCQLLNFVPYEAHDVLMDYIITPLELIKISNN